MPPRDTAESPAVAAVIDAAPFTAQVPIGFLPAAEQALLYDLPLPILREGAGTAIAWAADVLQDARTHRHIVALVGEKGVGKTDGIELAVRAFDAEERACKLQNDLYEEQRVVIVRTVRCTEARGFFHACYKAAFGVAMVDRARGRKRTTDELRDELIARARTHRIVTFVVDEAETVAAPVLEAIRDLVSAAAASDGSRLVIQPEATAARIRGIGVVLVGTLVLQELLRRHIEAGTRIARIQEVTGVEAAHVPEVLAAFLPAFAQAHADVPETWQQIVTRYVPVAQTIPVHRLARLTRAYVTRMVAIARMENAPIRDIADIGFDESVFAYIADETRTAMARAA